MRNLLAVANWATRASFLALAVLALVEWRRRKGRPAAWAAATFGVMAAVVLAGVAVGDNPPGWVAKPLIVVLLAFPYLLFRFMGAFLAVSRRLRVLAITLTVAVAGWTLVLPKFPRAGEPLVGPFRAYVVAILFQWTLLSVLVSVRLWRAGRGQPGVARRRMRLLAAASVGLSVALIISGGVNQTPNTAIQLVVQLVALVSAACFYLGLVPPGVLRMLWRHAEEAALRAAARELMGAATVGEVTSVLLPRLAPVLGGTAALIVDGDGRPVQRHGMDQAAAERLAARVRPGGQAEGGPDLMVFPLTSGWMAVQTSAFTPFFSDEEVELVKDLLSLADLALQRADLFDREHQAREEIQRVNTELESFVYSVSHDLRTPLISIRGYLDYLQADYGTALDGDGTRYLERMQASTLYMQQLIQDLLELSRIARMQVEPEEVDVAALLDEVAAELRVRHPGLVVDADRLPLLWVNPVRARQLFSNLLHNAAVHAGRPDVRVVVRAAVEPDGSLELSVADNGVGVPADYREKVFGVFERLDRDGSGGTGIGLPICRKIVEHLGGRIWFAGSEQGADLHLTLPAARVAKRASAGAPTTAAVR